jgi:lantibiotic biosynthesis protein
MNSEIPYECFPKFVLRTPLFHYSYINRLLDNNDTPEESIKDLCKNKIVQEAIFLASPDLHKEMIKWINNQIKDKKRSQNLIYSLTQYLIRMSSRCTPFGLFAGFSVGEWNDHTKIILDEISNNKRHTRFDMNYLCALAIDLAKVPDVKNNIKFYPNSSIYKSGDKLRYVEYKYKSARRSHHIVSVDYSDYLQHILEAASEGAYLKDLAQIIVNKEVSYEESLNFINELMDNQLLIPDLEPAITGQEFLEQMLDIIQGIENIDNYKNILKKV